MVAKVSALVGCHTRCVMKCSCALALASGFSPRFCSRRGWRRRRVGVGLKRGLHPEPRRGVPWRVAAAASFSEQSLASRGAAWAPGCLGPCRAGCCSRPCRAFGFLGGDSPRCRLHCFQGVLGVDSSPWRRPPRCTPARCRHACLQLGVGTGACVSSGRAAGTAAQDHHHHQQQQQQERAGRRLPGWERHPRRHTAARRIRRGDPPTASRAPSQLHPMEATCRQEGR
jgi:hypothetical protein